MSLILASSSPRRQALLAGCGIPFQTIPASIDERPLPHEVAEAYVRRLALEKAEIVARSHPRCLVLGADTTVSIDGHLLGKPVDRDDARRMLSQLNGRTHEVLTGIAVLRAAKAHALLNQRDYVAPDDVQAILVQTIAHRLVPVAGSGRGAREQVRAMVASLPV